MQLLTIFVGNSINKHTYLNHSLSPLTRDWNRQTNQTRTHILAEPQRTRTDMQKNMQNSNRSEPVKVTSGAESVYFDDADNATCKSRVGLPYYVLPGRLVVERLFSASVVIVRVAHEYKRAIQPCNTHLYCIVVTSWHCVLHHELAIKCLAAFHLHFKQCTSQRKDANQQR